ncbi:hypothetical protein BVX95_02240 [archaeon D22]|nr:hypothetical protein BVX95_02240 [archaeon D22]
MAKIKVGFGSITRKGKIENEIVVSFSKSFEKNNEIFFSVPKKVRLIVVDNEEEFKKLLKDDFHSWAKGFSYPGKIIIKSYELAKPDELKIEYYNRMLRHEMTHVFWHANFKTWKPRWICEGFANAMNDEYQIKKNEILSVLNKYSVKSDILDYRPLKKNLTNKFPRYPVWTNLVRYLIEREGVESILDFMKEYSKKPYRKTYDKLFLKFFNKTPTKLFMEFSESIKAQKKIDEY